jgi:hypothetical protein
MALAVDMLNVEPVRVGASPVPVNNWRYFDGSLLAIGVQYGDDELTIEGTAVMIGLGLAVSAKHVLDSHQAALASGECSLLCTGLRHDGTLEAWHCYDMLTSNDGGDLALRSLQLASDVPPDGHFSALPLSTRIPTAGEHLTVVGFRFDDPSWIDPATNAAKIGGLMYVSSGEAGVFSFPRHDSVLAPYATIEILSGTLGGMSGGAVLDSSGAVLGIVSRGWQTDDREGPTLAAWWLPVFFWRPKLSWPRGLYEPNAAVSELPTVNVIGREHVVYTSDGGIKLNHWKPAP